VSRRGLRSAPLAGPRDSHGDFGGPRQALLAGHSSRPAWARKRGRFLTIFGPVSPISSFASSRKEPRANPNLELMRRARTRGISVVFHLRNFGSDDRRAFADASAVIFPSEYTNVTGFTYSGGLLSKIADPAGRLATFTFSGTGLASAWRNDGSQDVRVSFTYDGSGRMTQYKDPRSDVVTVAYDPANRVGTITRRDLTVESFKA
jgi:YD repeat-containing protein